MGLLCVVARLWPLAYRREMDIIAPKLSRARDAQSSVCVMC